MLYYIGKDPKMPFATATVQEAYAYLKGLSVFALDTETTDKKLRDSKGKLLTSKVYKGGLDPYLSKVIMLQVGDLEKQFVIDTRTEDIAPLLPLFSDPSILKILHNAKFDGKMVFASFGVWLVNVWDTMLAQNVKENGLRVGYAMDKCAERVLGYKSKKPINKDLFDEELTEEEEDEWYGNRDVYLIDRADSKIIDKSIREAFATKGDKPFTIKEVEYGGDDVVIPYKLYLNQKNWLETGEWKPELAVRLENKFSQVLARIEYTGFNLTWSMWEELNVVNKNTMQVRLKALKDYAESNPKLKKFCSQLDLFNDQPGCSVQWSSPAQVIAVFRTLGICPKERSKSTKKDEWTVSAKALYKTMSQEFRDWFDDGEDQPIVDEKTFSLGYMLFKKSQMCCTTFGLDYKEYIHPVTGMIHSSFKQMMSTTRMCVDVNTVITTDKGPIRIGDIIPSEEGTVEIQGLRAKTHTGEYHSITHGINKGVEFMYEVELEDGRMIVCTEAHIFFTSLGWLSLKDILSLQTESTEVLIICTYNENTSH